MEKKRARELFLVIIKKLSSEEKISYSASDESWKFYFAAQGFDSNDDYFSIYLKNWIKDETDIPTFTICGSTEAKSRKIIDCVGEALGEGEEVYIDNECGTDDPWKVCGIVHQIVPKVVKEGYGLGVDPINSDFSRANAYATMVGKVEKGKYTIVTGGRNYGRTEAQREWLSNELHKKGVAVKDYGPGILTESYRMDMIDFNALPIKPEEDETILLSLMFPIV